MLRASLLRRNRYRVRIPQGLHQAGHQGAHPTTVRQTVKGNTFKFCQVHAEIPDFVVVCGCHILSTCCEIYTFHAPDEASFGDLADFLAAQMLPPGIPAWGSRETSSQGDTLLRLPVLRGFVLLLTCWSLPHFSPSLNQSAAKKASNMASPVLHGQVRAQADI